MKKNRILALTLTILLLASVFSACAAKSQSAAMESAMAAPAAAEAPAAMATEAAMPEEAFVEGEPEVYALDAVEEKAKEEPVGGVGYQEQGQGEQQPQDVQTDFAAKIIYSANVAIQTTDFDGSLQTLEKTVSGFGGFIEASNVFGDTTYGDDGSMRVINRWAYYTVRIPQAQFEAFLKSAGTLGNVYSSGRNAENVTSRYTDYEARLDSLHTQEDRLLAMLEKSEDVETLIALESRLADVRYETESIERNLRNLDMQISYSTVSIDLQEVEVYTPSANVVRSFGEKISDAFQSGWRRFSRGVQNFCVDLVEALPVLLILALIAAAVILLIRKLLKKRAARRTPPTGSYTESSAPKPSVYEKEENGSDPEAQ